MLGYRNICIVYMLLLLGVPIRAGEDNFDNLHMCEHFQACGSRVQNFPIVEESIGEMVEDIGSGHGSGDEHVPMLYDEFVTSKPPFDFEASPELVQKRLCRCPDETKDDQKCSFDEEDSVMKIDSTLNLAFCQPVKDTIRSKCLGRRQLVRVMGKIHDTGEALTDVDDTAVFCSCSDGYQRARIEPWLSGYVFSYRCTK